MSTATRTASPSATDRRRLPAMAVVDLVLAVALLAVALFDPFDLSTGARWAIAGLGDVALLLAVVGVVRARRAVGDRPS